jgi:hypothetical protein
MKVESIVKSFTSLFFEKEWLVSFFLFVRVPGVDPQQTAYISTQKNQKIREKLKSAQ